MEIKDKKMYDDLVGEEGGGEEEPLGSSPSEIIDRVIIGLICLIALLCLCLR